MVRNVLIGTVVLAILLNLCMRVYGWYRLNDTEFLRLRAVADEIIDKGDRIITNGDGSPAMLYFADRKGWSPDDPVFTQEYLEGRIIEGARYAVIDKDKVVPDADWKKYELIYSGRDFNIYRLH